MRIRKRGEERGYLGLPKVEQVDGELGVAKRPSPGSGAPEGIEIEVLIFSYDTTKTRLMIGEQDFKPQICTCSYSAVSYEAFYSIDLLPPQLAHEHGKCCGGGGRKSAAPSKVQYSSETNPATEFKLKFRLWGDCVFIILCILLRK